MCSEIQKNPPSVHQQPRLGTVQKDAVENSEWVNEEVSSKEEGQDVEKV